MGHYTIISHSGIFPPPVPQAERLLLHELSLDLNYIKSKAREFVRLYTPYVTGLMYDNVATWGGRRGSLGGFSFYLGWKSQEVPYAGWVNAGTGIYGKFHTPIIPRTKPYLAWQDDDGNWIRRLSVRGQKPQNILPQAIADWNEWFQRYLEFKRVHTYRSTV